MTVQFPTYSHSHQPTLQPDTTPLQFTDNPFITPGIAEDLHSLINGKPSGTNTTSAASQTSAVGVALDGAPEGLSAEGLLLYLQTRMQNLDGQVNGIFDKMQNVEKLRKLLTEMQTELNKLSDDQAETDLQTQSLETGQVGFENKMNQTIDNIEQIDPQLARKLRAMLNEEGQILYVQDGKYFTREVSNSRELLNNITKQLESGAQMDMIRLQSIMSARGTFIQMTSNLIAGLSEPMKTVVGNMR